MVVDQGVLQNKIRIQHRDIPLKLAAQPPEIRNSEVSFSPKYSIYIGS